MEIDALEESHQERSSRYLATTGNLGMLSHSLSVPLTNQQCKTAAPCILSADNNGHRHSSDQSVHSAMSQAGVVISQIEDIFESILVSMIDKRAIAIHLKRRAKPGNQYLDDESGVIRESNSVETRAVRFPGGSEKEAWKFTALLRILELSHEALVTGIVTTKRDIYYRAPRLFVKQDVVDRYVDDLAFTLGVGRDALNIVATAKGLVTGALRIMRKDDVVIDCQVEVEGILVPSIKDIGCLDLSNAQWILVIEKEATFRTLATSLYWKTSSAGKGILITAKGYPDIQTRAFTRLLSLQWPSLPVFGLVDFDPDGLGIVSTYKHGSASLAHQNESLAVPGMTLLGLQSSDITIQDGSERNGGQGLLVMTGRDRKMAMQMLEKDCFQVETEPIWRRELQVMLMLNWKAEIQILSTEGGLSSWLDEKLKRKI